MNTKQYQLLLLQLIKDKEPGHGADEPYVVGLKNSVALEVAKDVSIWWRSMQIERYCFISANYLKLHAQFDPVVKAFYQATNVSPYIERVGQSFLDFLQQSNDPLLVTVANFEDKLKKVKKGDTRQYSIAWGYEPYAVIYSLINSTPLQLENIKGNYVTNIGATIENNFEVVNL